MRVPALRLSWKTRTVFSPFLENAVLFLLLDLWLTFSLGFQQQQYYAGDEQQEQGQQTHSAHLQFLQGQQGQGQQAVAGQGQGQGQGQGGQGGQGVLQPPFWGSFPHKH